MATISAYIRKKRKELKLTQEELAFKSGVGLRFVRELEGGKATLRLDKVNQILYLFGKQVGIIDLINDNKQKGGND